MVKYRNIIKAIENTILKTHLNNEQKLEIWNGLSNNVKKLLINELLPSSDSLEWSKIQRRNTEHMLGTYKQSDDSWEIEKKVFDHIPPTRIANIEEHCKNFDKWDYYEDDEEYDYDSYYSEIDDYKEELMEGGYSEEEADEIANDEISLETYYIEGPREHEQTQIELQEEAGYPEGLPSAISNYWVCGYYYEMNHYVLTGEKAGDHWKDEIPVQCDLMTNYINESIGLGENTILWRGGHWDNLKIGQIGTIPCFNSTSYDKYEADYIGRSLQEQYKKEPYLIKIYADKGTKGCCVNADSLAPEYGDEHEYLLGKGQKYIVLNVDDEKHEATIKLI